MLALRPTTLDVVRALAMGILAAPSGDNSECGGTGDMEGLAVLMYGLTGVPIE